MVLCTTLSKKPTQGNGKQWENTGRNQDQSLAYPDGSRIRKPKRELNLPYVLEVTKAKPSGTNTWQGHCPVHDDKNPSLSITNEGGKVLVHCHAGCPQEDIYNALATPVDDWDYAFQTREIVKKDKPANDPWEAVAHIPNNAPKQLTRFKNYPPPSKAWKYFNEEGNPVFYAVRFDLGDGKKDVIPQTLWRNKLTGALEWRWKAYPAPRPLYNLHCLAGHPDRPVVVVEGEKAADAAARLFPYHVITTSPGGCQAAGKTDWMPIKGRDVIVWPDADDPGLKYADDVARLAHAAGAASVKVLPVLDEKPQGWDAADALAEGWTPERAVEYLKTAKSLTPTAMDVTVDIGDEAGEWEDPVLFDDIHVPEIDPGLFPGWLAEYIRAVSEHTQTPIALPAMIALSILATCLQKKFIVSPFDGYAEPLNLWTLVALPPATRKSPVFNAMTAHLADWEKSEADRWQPEIDRIMTERNVIQDRIKKLQADAAKAEDPDERKRLIGEICTLKEEMPPALMAPRLWTSDCTPERLQNLLLDHGERMSLLSDEGGIFEILSGLYNDGKANIDVFLQAHAGSPVRVDRQTRTVCLNSPVLSFGLTVQPEILREMSRGSKRRFRGLGALARFLYVVPPSNIGTRDIFQQIPVPERIASSYARQIRNLIAIPLPEEPSVLSLDREALDAWKRFSQFIEINQGNHKPYEAIQDWTGKLPGAALRIAGNFHVAEYGEGNPTIGLHTMENALDLSNLLIEHAQAAFGLMGSDPAIEDAKTILHWIKTNGAEQFTQREAHRAVRGKIPRVDRLTKALDELCGRGIIGSPEAKPTGGRPSIHFKVNPKVFQEEKS
ncbi:MAG: DUF3987 domain-containing protein [Candidatus Omnitrophica bacterium]|nr:DUF3987 domain-containing protein [Candidatus Omnitrophota bacterium]